MILCVVRRDLYFIIVIIVVVPCSGTRKLVMVESIWPTFARAPMARQACRPCGVRGRVRGEGKKGRKVG